MQLVVHVMLSIISTDGGDRCPLLSKDMLVTVLQDAGLRTTDVEKRWNNLFLIFFKATSGLLVTLVPLGSIRVLTIVRYHTELISVQH